MTFSEWLFVLPPPPQKKIQKQRLGQSGIVNDHVFIYSIYDFFLFYYYYIFFFNTSNLYHCVQIALM